jgi:hypothetical protein
MSSVESLRLFDTVDAGRDLLRAGAGHSASLDRIRKAAHAEEVAGRALRTAIEKARAAGCSWREIARAADKPHQSIHRRYAMTRYVMTKDSRKRGHSKQKRAAGAENLIVGSGRTVGAS